MYLQEYLICTKTLLGAQVLITDIEITSTDQDIERI